ncbi:hypothetical protein [Corynebacterium sp.]|uniref:hypothetical protein n=1 Tax=Corynebacterium sp. TaxID=1720 RepID=UPI0025BB667F|nr:hypothetical protein [Corynebacterium sp.]
MHRNEETAAPVAAETTVKSDYQAAHSSDYATPHHLTLHPTSGADWWSWCISINGRPAIRFRDIDLAALAVTFLLDDMENGEDITRRAALWCVAESALRPQDFDARAYEICNGW